MQKMKIALVLLILLPAYVSAQTYELKSSVIDEGGTKMTSTGYILRGSFGQLTCGKDSSSNYIAHIGFWHPPYAPPTAIEDYLKLELAPTAFSLSQNYPNPAFSNTNIKYTLPKTTDVKLKIYNTAGQLVKTFSAGKQKPGFYKISWDGRNDKGQRVRPGVYFYRLKTDDSQHTKKLILLR